MKPIFTLIAVAGLIYTGTASAQTADATRKTPEQAIKTEIESTFVRIDKDKNGSLSRAEFGTFMEEAIGKQVEIFNQTFDTLDLDKDGKISRGEATENKAFAVGFDDIDTDKDSFVSKEELAMAMKAAQEAKPASSN